MNTMEMFLLGIGIIYAMCVNIELLFILLFIFAVETRRYVEKCEVEESKRHRRRLMKRFHGEED